MALAGSRSERAGIDILSVDTDVMRLDYAKQGIAVNESRTDIFLEILICSSDSHLREV